MASQDLTQLPKTRKDAIASGNAFYFTGVPCKSGHISKRYSLHRSCFECCSQRNKTPERKIYMSGYRKKNPEKIKTLNKNWFLKNKEHHHHYQNKYRSDNVEKVQQFARERCRKYRKNNPEKVRAHDAKRRGCPGSFKHTDIVDLLKKQKYKCINCLCSVKDAFHVDHVMPIKLGGTNWPNNLQILCPKCNLRKNAKHPIEWASLNGRLL
jgi:5-methylcytosine-specific restriction endonuclease McrA